MCEIGEEKYKEKEVLYLGKRFSIVHFLLKDVLRKFACFAYKVSEQDYIAGEKLLPALTQKERP